MNSSTAIPFFLLVCAALLGEGQSLTCYQCEGPSCPATTPSDVMELDCAMVQDTCYTFEGAVRSYGQTFAGRTTRTCVAFSLMEAFGQGVKRNSCTNVTDAKDVYKEEYYTGRLRLCDSDY